MPAGSSSDVTLPYAHLADPEAVRLYGDPVETCYGLGVALAVEHGMLKDCCFLVRLCLCALQDARKEIRSLKGEIAELRRLLDPTALAVFGRLSLLVRCRRQLMMAPAMKLRRLVLLGRRSFESRCFRVASVCRCGSGRFKRISIFVRERFTVCASSLFWVAVV